MNNQETKIIERVRQLLAMAADTSSPHEAAIAAGRARKLMDMHQISVEDLKDEKTGFGFRKVDKAYRFMPKWKDILAVAVGKFNDCKVSKAHEWKVEGSSSYAYRLLFQGFEVDVIVAAATYDYLTATIDRMCAAYMSTLGYDKYIARIGDAYKKQASITLCHRLAQLQSERERDLRTSTGTSLVVIKSTQVEAEFGAAQYTVRALKSRADAQTELAKRQGRADGQRISLNTQVDTGPTPPRHSIQG